MYSIISVTFLEVFSSIFKFFRLLIISLIYFYDFVLRQILKIKNI